MNFEEEINEIKARNRRVELAKAWEVSKTRRYSIIVLTYFVMVLVMSVLGNAHPTLDAIIPTLGFLLSTLSMDIVKHFWLKKYLSKDE